MSLQYMTQEGLDKLKKELAEAIAQRPVISAAIAEVTFLRMPSMRLQERRRAFWSSISQNFRILLRMHALSTSLRSERTRCRCSIR